MKKVGALLVLALALPIAGGEAMTYAWKTKRLSSPHLICKMNVLLDVGCSVQLTDVGSILVHQDNQTADPFHNYRGCTSAGISGNVAYSVWVVTRVVGATGGTWDSTISPTQAQAGYSRFTICTTGRNVKFDRITRRGTVKVAQVSFWVMPTP